MLPLPLILLGGGLASLGYGLYSKKASPAAKAASTPPATPPDPTDGLRRGTPPELASACQALIANSQDPNALEQMAVAMDNLGYTDLATALRMREKELQAPSPSPSPSPAPPLPTPPSFDPSMLPIGTPYLQQGSQSSAVQAWQQFLLSQGYSMVGTADGIFGANTLAGTVAFQKAAGIAADGIVGPGTIAAAKAALGGALPVPSPTPSASSTATVKGTGVNVRLGNSTSAQPVGTVSAPQIVTVLNWNAGTADGHDWAQIQRSDGLRGYVAKDYLSLNAPSPPAVSGLDQAFAVGAESRERPKLAQCASPSGCRLRDRPTGASPFKTLVGHGETVAVLKRHPGPKAEQGSPGAGGWCLVRYKNMLGWVPSEWLVY